MKEKKYKSKFLTLVMAAVIALISMVTTASAATERTVAGVSVIWVGAIIIFIGILMWIFIMALKKNPKTFLALFLGGIIFIALGATTIVFLGVEEPGEVSIMPEGVSWDVGDTPTVTGGNATVGDNVITLRFGANASAGTMTYPINYAAGDTEEDWEVPEVNFTIRVKDERPAVPNAGDTVYSSNCRSSAASQITIGGTNYNFFDKTTGLTEKNQVNWTFDGATEYEGIDVQLNGGETATVSVTLNPNRAGFSQLDEYRTKSMTLNVVGETWTIVFECVEDNDNTV